MCKSISSHRQAIEHASTQRPRSFVFTSPYFFLLPLFFPALDTPKYTPAADIFRFRLGEHVWRTTALDDPLRQQQRR